MNTPVSSVAAETGEARKPGRISLLAQMVFACVTGAAFLYLVRKQIDFGEISALLRTVHTPFIALSLAAYACDFVLRAVRFRAMLNIVTGKQHALGPTIAPFIASFGISDLLPFRAGDAYRVFWFHKRLAIPVGTVIGAMLVERLLDLVSVILVGAVMIACMGSLLPPVFAARIQILLACILFASLTVLIAPAMTVRITERLFGSTHSSFLLGCLRLARSISDAVTSLGSLRRMAGFVVASIFLWALEGLVFLGVWLGLGQSLGSWAKPGLAFASATLGTLVPALPGHFGSFEFFGMQAFTISGTDPSLAAAVVTLAHLVLWLPTAIFSVVWLLTNPRNGGLRPSDGASGYELGQQ